MDNSERQALAPDETRETEGLRLVVLDCELTVCKCAEIPVELLQGGFCCITRTDEEISVVCETAKAPGQTTEREDGWRALKVCGPLDFGLVGILSRISSALVGAGVALFAISTFDTDYVLVKANALQAAISALRGKGCQVIE